MAEAAVPAALEPRLEAIYREHHGFVWSSLARLGVPSASLDDACQDVFLVVFRRLDSFEGRSQLRTWLFSIARRVAFRHRRDAQRAQRKANALALEPPRVENLEELFEHKRAATVVLHALSELDDDKRTAVVLYVLEGMSGPQIAEMLELPVDTAYSRIKAGRRVLRSRLKALGVDDDARVYEAARRQTQPSDRTTRRVAALLALRMNATPVILASLWKGAAAITALGFVGVLGARALTPDEPPLAQVTVPESPTSDAPPVPPTAPSPQVALPEVPPQPEDPPAPASIESVNRRSKRSFEIPPTDSLREEVTLIGAVRRGLEAGQPSDVLATLDRHASRFPHGELAVERRAYRAIALCRLGKNTQGRGRGRIFVKAHPNATLAGQVRLACDLEETPGRE